MSYMYFLFQLCQVLGEKDVLKFGWTSKCHGVCIACQTSPGFFCDPKKSRLKDELGWGKRASLQFVRLRYSWVWTGERNLVHMLVPLPHWVVEALQVLRCLRSGFNYKGIFIDLNCLIFLWYPLHQSKQEIKFQTKAVIGQFQCFIMLTDWLMLNKKTSSHLHSFKTVRLQWHSTYNNGCPTHWWGARRNTLRLYQADVLGIGKLCFHDRGIRNTGEAWFGLLEISMILDLSLKNRHLEILPHKFISFIIVTFRC